jgi:hypothetical protein
VKFFIPCLSAVQSAFAETEKGQLTAAYNISTQTFLSFKTSIRKSKGNFIQTTKILPPLPTNPNNYLWYSCEVILTQVKNPELF